MIYDLGEVVKHHRTAKKLTQAQLAEGICSRQTINKLELGERKPHKFVLNQILLKLGLSPQDFDLRIGLEDVTTLQFPNVLPL